jgi:hypothetical protein
VFTLAVTHGNSGLGNGLDAAAPGHDTDFNDGYGTSPGHPGAAHIIGVPHLEFLL